MAGSHPILELSPMRRQSRMPPKLVGELINPDGGMCGCDVHLERVFWMGR
jgi:hypothetical protein